MPMCRQISVNWRNSQWLTNRPPGLEPFSLKGNTDVGLLVKISKLTAIKVNEETLGGWPVAFCSRFKEAMDARNEERIRGDPRFKGQRKFSQRCDLRKTLEKLQGSPQSVEGSKDSSVTSTSNSTVNKGSKERGKDLENVLE